MKLALKLSLTSSGGGDITPPVLEDISDGGTASVHPADISDGQSASVHPTDISDGGSA